MSDRGGFTLIEILVAASLALLVMLGTFAVMGSMARFQRVTLTKSAVVGWSAASLGGMSADFEQATVLVLPTSGSPNGNALAFCQNWSNVTGNFIDQSNPVATTVVYCGAANPDGTLTLYRAALNGCVAAGAVAACPPGGAIKEAVASGARLDGTHATLFSYDPSTNGMQVNYTVGNPNPTANLQVPQSMTLNATLMSRQQLEVN